MQGEPALLVSAGLSKAVRFPCSEPWLLRDTLRTVCWKRWRFPTSTNDVRACPRVRRRSGGTLATLCSLGLAAATMRFGLCRSHRRRLRFSGTFGKRCAAFREARCSPTASSRHASAAPRRRGPQGALVAQTPCPLSFPVTVSWALAARLEALALVWTPSAGCSPLREYTWTRCLGVR